MSSACPANQIVSALPSGEFFHRNFRPLREVAATWARGCFWHMNCEIIFSDRIMAMKIKMLTLLQEKRGYAQVTNRLPAPRPGVLFLMKLRAQANQSAAPRRRLSILVEVNKGPATPLPVKINHVNQNSATVQLSAR
jgi:hypothetical protein